MILSAKVALVTGGARGIGRVIAESLAREGYDIAFCYQKSTDHAMELEAELKALGRKVFHAACDVADPAAAEQFIGQAVEHLGDIDVLVNNAGITRDAPLVLMRHEDWKRVIDVNLSGVFNFSKGVIFSMMKRKAGCIINISSYSGIHGIKAQTNYSASKAGIIGFTKALAKETGSCNIRVNAVAPGFIDTDMIRELPEKELDMKRKSSLGHVGQAQDVADMVVFLASDKARYITGQVFQVDGGLLF